MTHVPAPESTESDAGPESGPASDGDAQDAQDAREAIVKRAAIDHHLVGFSIYDTACSCGGWPTVEGPAHHVEHVAMEVLNSADADLAPLRARVAELEALLTTMDHFADVAEVCERKSNQYAARNAELEGEVERLRAQIDTGRGATQHWRAEAYRMGGRVESAEAALARVEALVDEPDDVQEWEDVVVGDGQMRRVAVLDVDRLRAALASAAPAVSDGEGATSEAGEDFCGVCFAGTTSTHHQQACEEPERLRREAGAPGVMAGPDPTPDPRREARIALADLRTDTGFVLGDVIAQVVLDSGLVIPAEASND